MNLNIEFLNKKIARLYYYVSKYAKEQNIDPAKTIVKLRQTKDIEHEHERRFKHYIREIRIDQ